jgi:lipopolysaccharide export system permease protein
MTRMDRVILLRLGSRIALTVLVVFGIIILSESLNTWRFQSLSSIGGPLLGIAGIVVTAARWTFDTLPVTLLIGAIIGLLDLQARRELTVIKATGLSVWRVLRMPLVAVVAVSIVTALVADSAVVSISRALSISLPQAGSNDELWLSENGSDGREYVIYSPHPGADGTFLEDAVIFLAGSGTGSGTGSGRILAERVELEPGAWRIASGTHYAPDEPPRPADGVRLATTTTAADMGVRLRSASELTFFEIAAALSQGISDPVLRARVEMRFFRLVSLPLTLAGSLLIAFAFTAGYRRTNKYGGTVLYGIVLGFVVYVITEMAALAGAAGVLRPSFAAIAPAVVAMVIGTTVLLFKEDGRI